MERAFHYLKHQRVLTLWCVGACAQSDNNSYHAQIFMAFIHNNPPFSVKTWGFGDFSEIVFCWKLCILKSGFSWTPWLRPTCLFVLWLKDYTDGFPGSKITFNLFTELYILFEWERGKWKWPYLHQLVAVHRKQQLLSSLLPWESPPDCFPYHGATLCTGTQHGHTEYQIKH